MTPDDLLAKVREARVRAEKHLYRGDAAHAEREIEWLDIIEGLVARVLERPALPPEPPPGKMRVTASVPVTYDVSPGQIAAYLRAKGWAVYDRPLRWEHFRHTPIRFTTSRVTWRVPGNISPRFCP